MSIDQMSILRQISTALLQTLHKAIAQISLQLHSALTQEQDRHTLTSALAATTHSEPTRFQLGATTSDLRQSRLLDITGPWLTNTSVYTLILFGFISRFFI